MRTLSNKPGTVYDENDPYTLYAEDWNELVSLIGGVAKSTREVTGADTLLASDVGNIVILNKTSMSLFTMPKLSLSDWPIGGIITFVNTGSGGTTFFGSGGMVVRGPETDIPSYHGYIAKHIMRYSETACIVYNWANPY